MNKRNEAEASVINLQRSEKSLPKPAAQITISPETITSSPLSIVLDDFLFAESDNNYSTVYFFKEGIIHRELLRLSLKNLANQLQDFKDIVRCHRSYLVNKSRITKITGNARSLVLKVDGYKGQIPVSRNFPKDQLV